MRKNIPFVVLALLCLNIDTQSQTKMPEPVPLKIGDQLPESFWTHEHDFYKHGKIIKQNFSPYKGKLLILDFWATWCSSCLLAFPKMTLLEKKFGDRIVSVKVTDQPMETLVAFEHGPAGSALERTTGSKLSSVVKDQALASLFPHHVLPHIIYVGPDGTVLGFSDAEDLNAEVVTNMLTGKKGIILNKKDYNTDRPLFIDDADDMLIAYTVLYKGYISGLATGNYYRRKNGQVYGKAMANFPLLNLYSFAAGQLHSWVNSKRILLEVENRGELTAYDQDSADPRMRSSLYTVDICLSSLRKDSLYADMLSTLNRNTSYNGAVDQRITKCLVLKKITKGNSIPAPLNSAGGMAKASFYSDGEPGVFRNVPISSLVLRLNNLEDMKPLVIDETGIQQKVDMQLAPYTSLQALNRDLHRYDLQLQEAERLLDVFVIRDKISTN
jgi:thiol-disulfide isomerase/thioredoxin